ncbi:hypothetical protein [Streptomyces sp. NBC_01483]|uniref:hypothetical protein n=1 Tax=Streptomyces sp. NBC_01483 TaxID=2903883 RepID=UPI002E3478E0|nr:hypothetical protein [Streptomyces sp. NBC_01483]
MVSLRGAADQVLSERAELERLWSQRLERAAQNADRARRSHHLAEPENRLVVRPGADRKEIIRAVVDKIVVTVLGTSEQVKVTIVWTGER